MLRDVRPSELGLWAALWQIDPWGRERGDLQAGIIASIIAEANRDHKRRSEPFAPLDFMPFQRMSKEDREKELSAKIRRGLLGAGKGKPKGKKPK